MSFGFGFGFTKITAAIRAAFSPSSLFAANEPGVWYDPSDLSTLFQDAAGTTPVTAVEQPVGLMLDKSRGLGSELVTNGTFDTDISGWVASPQFPSSSAVEWSNGSLHVYNTENNYGESRSAAIPLTIGKRYVLEMDILNGTTSSYWIIISNSERSDNVGRIAVTSEVSGTSPSGYKRWRYSFVASYDTAYLYFATNKLAGSHLYADNISVRELFGNHAYQTTATSRPVLSARVNQYLATETLATQNVTTLAAQYRLSFEGTGTITLSGTATGVYSAGSHLITCTAGTLTSTVSGSVTKADLRVANDGANLPPYQRVNTATDYDTAGFQHYLCFDGVDDRLVTAGIVWSAACDCFTAVRHTGGAQWVDVWLTTDLGSGYWAVGQSGSSYPPNQTTVGSPAYFVDGTALNPVTRGEIYTRCINQTRIVETRRLNLMASTGGLSIGGYPSYLLNGRLCGLVIAEGVTDAEASSVRRWLAGKAGVAL